MPFMFTENNIIENLSNHLIFHMLRSKETINDIARSIDVNYQLLYRALKKLTTPSFELILKLSNHLNCTYLELINDKLFLDVEVVEDLNLIAKSNADSRLYRIYINFEDREIYVKNNLVGVIKNEILDKVSEIDVYTFNAKFSGPGKYIMMVQDNYLRCEVIGVRKNFLLAIDVEGNQVKLNVDEINVIAKLIDGAICMEYTNIMQGIRLK